MTGDEWARLGIIIGAGFLYFGAFLTLSVCISCLTRSSSNAFLMLLMAWILAVLIIPRTAVLIAGRAVEVPTVDEIASQKTKLSSQLWGEDRKTMAAFKPASSVEPDKVMEQFNQLMQKIADERDKKMQELSKQLNEERANRQHLQQQFALNLARISPTATFSLSASTLAGTAPSLEQHYKDAATAYQSVFAAFMKKKTGMITGGRMMIVRNAIDDGKKTEPINPHELPEFIYHPMTLQELFGPSIIDLGLLVFFTLLFFLGAYISFLRYDVR
jgi:ABC-type transport system involved in multi-copper enzyme maturation permease subunit